jgi:hypothetical protein
MHTEAMAPSAGRRAEELGFAAQHFSDLQGLKVVPLFAVLLVSLTLPHHIFARASVPEILTGLATFASLSIAWILCIASWYRRQYGFAKQKTERPETLPGLRLAMVLVLVCMVMPILFTRGLDSRPTELLIIVVTMLLPRAFLVIPDSSLLSWRRLFYRLAAALLTGLLLAADLVPSLRLAALYSVVTIVLLLSLYDHWLLGNLLGHRPKETNGDGL